MFNTWSLDPEVRVFADNGGGEELSSGLAEYVDEVSEEAVKKRGCFSLVLSGGDIPRLLRKLASLPYVRTTEWSRWHLFWAEENVVPKRHPDSFYMQAKHSFISKSRTFFLVMMDFPYGDDPQPAQLLTEIYTTKKSGIISNVSEYQQVVLKKVPIPSAHVVPVAFGVTGEAAANAYEYSIRQLVRNRTVPASPSTDCPRFDLVILRLGSDGRISSFYPNHPVLEEDSQWVTAVSSPDARMDRVTLTLPVVNATANVAIVASGNNVARPFRDAVVRRRNADGSSPAHLIRPIDGNLVWFADAGAASMLSLRQYAGSTSGSRA